jgi:hypothetical protein
MNMLRLILLSAAAAVGLSVASGAMAQSASNSYGERVANACAGTGFNAAEAPYVYCEMSLQDSVASVERARATGVAWRVCARRGYRFGTVSFANCVLDRQESGPPPEAPAPAPVAAETSPDFYHRDQMTSVRHACAQIGLAPGTAEYQTCVGNLSATINDSEAVGGDD